MPKSVREPRPKLTAEELCHYRVVESFQQLLRRHLKDRSLTDTETDPRRRLAIDDYFSLVLFGLFNPVVRSLRGLSAASHLKVVQERVCSHPVSLGSLSEAQHHFEPGVLLRVLQDCAGRAQAHLGQDAQLLQKLKFLHAHDSTVIRALPRMAWALWMDEQNRGVRIHLDFEVCRQMPDDVAVVPAAQCERKVWRPRIRGGTCYVADRYFGHDYNLPRLIELRGSTFVLRLHENAYFKAIKGTERQLSTADRQAGVEWDGEVYLRHHPPHQRFRLVRVRVGELALDLITNLKSLSAQEIALIYRHRWQVEVFFKWLKCILGCEHWLAESPQGVAIQVYCALIASVLLALWSGRRPTKRAMEALRFYQLGLADDDELGLLLHRAKML